MTNGLVDGAGASDVQSVSTSAHSVHPTRHREDRMNTFDPAHQPATCAAQNSLQDLFSLMGTRPPANTTHLGTAVTVRRVNAGGTLFHEGADALAIHLVRNGAFKIVRTGEDGYEQVLGFAYRGDLLGYDALWDRCQRVAAVALEEASVFAVPIQDFFALWQSEPAFERGVLRAVGRSLRGFSQLADMMAAVAADVRLARFLSQLSEQMAATGQSRHSLRLRMPRRDIASYLGVAHETISRSFTTLSEHGLVMVDYREVEILDLDGLHRFAQGTRTPARGCKPRVGVPLRAPRVVPFLPRTSGLPIMAV